MSAMLVSNWISLNVIYTISILVLPLLVMLVQRLVSSSALAKKSAKGIEVTGESGLPILGYLPVHYKPLRELFDQLSSKHGEIFKVHVLGRDYYILNSYRSFKEALAAQGDNFISRPNEFTYWGWVTDYKGTTMDHGEGHRIHRQFVIQSLRRFGMGNSKLEPFYHEVQEKVWCHVQQTNGQPTDLHDILCLTVTNALCKLMYNRTYQENDDEYRIIKDCSLTIFEKLPNLVSSLSGPWVRLFLANPLIKRYRTVVDKKKKLYKIVYSNIQQHSDKFDENNINDYIDAFLEEMKANKGETFEVHRMASVICLIFLAGLDTTLNTLYFGLNLIAKHPDVQTKMQNEIDDIVGHDRMICYDDRHRLKYVSAVIAEINRYIVLNPFGLTHSNNEDAIVCGYRIPKNSNILPNYWAYSRNAAAFPNPDCFDPKNFLDENENLVKRDSNSPFSIGKRVCVGEQLAMMTVFFVITGLLQRYTLKPPPGQEVRHEPNERLIRSLNPYELCAIPRV